MQRKPSVAKRLRKLSDSVINTLAPESTSRPAATQRRTRKVSVDEISMPAPHPAYSIDGWITKDDVARERPPRPARPSVDQRPPVVRDPKAREIEREGFRALNTAKRPQRPREEDLPYGAKGAVPIHLAKELLGEAGTPEGSSVPFPTTAQGATASAYPKKKPSQTERQGEREARPSRAQKGELTAQYRFPPEPRPVVFSPFAPTGRDVPGRRTGRAPEEKHPFPETQSTTRVGTPASLASDTQNRREAKGKGRTEKHEQREPAVCLAEHEATTVRRQGAIRRTSRASEAALPPQHLRDRYGRSDDALVQASTPLGVDLKRSQSMATRRPPGPPPASPSPSLSPNHPRPTPRDIPRDVRPYRRENFTFPTLSGDSEGGETEHSELMLVPPAPVATPRLVAKAQANMPLRYPPVPRDVQLSAPDPHRATSFRGQVGRVERAQAKPSGGPAREERTREYGARRGRGQTVEISIHTLTDFFDAETELPTVAPLMINKKSRAGEQSGRSGR
ncbi:hypothetical protein BV20DRAFT_1050197 [Pilatotrama ljubarskyi]|nr:hypothetical protein BV20DRAFT_1050197 [Pilatotrama ljubarskyi]